MYDWLLVLEHWERTSLQWKSGEDIDRVVREKLHTLRLAMVKAYIC